jgi:hypothetical protein
MGRLLRTLEITNLKSLRTYFLTLVSSQQYGLELFNFGSEDYNRAAKIFLLTVFCLPDSFPINVARNLLHLQHFELVSFDSPLCLAQRLFTLNPDHMMAKALRFDSKIRSVVRSGFSHDLISFLAQFFDVSDLDSLSLDDVSYLQDLRDQLSIQCDDIFRSSFRRSSGLHFYADLNERVWLPVGFGEFLGSLDYEIARIVILFMGDVFRFSLAVSGSMCPFCPIQFHAQHLFCCPNCPFRDSLPPWSSFVQAFQISDWATVVQVIMLGFSVWQNHTSFFRTSCKDRVSIFLGRDIGH